MRVKEHLAVFSDNRMKEICPARAWSIQVVELPSVFCYQINPRFPVKLQPSTFTKIVDTSPETNGSVGLALLGEMRNLRNRQVHQRRDYRASAITLHPVFRVV